MKEMGKEANKSGQPRMIFIGAERGITLGVISEYAGRTRYAGRNSGVRWA